MPAERYFFPGELRLNQTVVLTDKEFRHAVHVMRNQLEDRIEIVNGQGTLAIAALKAIKKEEVVLEVLQIEQTAPLSVEIILAQAIPRLNRLDDILEKVTELGATQIWLYPAQESERKEINEHQFNRLEAIIISAMKQCGRLWLPKLVLMKALTLWEKPEGTLFFGDTDPQAELFIKKWNSQTIEGKATFFIGPEKGFSEREEERLRSWGAYGVKLARYILRTDTAALAAMALLSQVILET